jgi:hypothetical protein
MQATGKPLGFKTLRQLLQSYDTKFIGVFGYPHVGKKTVDGYLKMPSMLLPKKTKTRVANMLVQNDTSIALNSKDVEAESLDLTFLYRPQHSANSLNVLTRFLERVPCKKQLVLKLNLRGFKVRGEHSV